MTKSKRPIVYCPIDTKDIGHAKELIASVTSAGCGVKLGLEFFNANGPQGVQTILDDCGAPDIFLDLKYHDIPNTVAGAVAAAASLDVSYLNVHAAGGREMMVQAKRACPARTGLLAVTVLTSLDEADLRSVGQDDDAVNQVQRLARLTQEAGLDGVVCSAREVRQLRNALGEKFVLMVPGIRPAGSDTGDQKRVMTPKEAMDAGATHLVIGRPITQAKDPAQAARDIIASMN